MPAAKIKDFTQRTSKNCSVYVKRKNAAGIATAVDMRQDTVVLNIVDKQVGGKLLFTKGADVTSMGQQGIAIFRLLPTDTNIPVGVYYCNVIWTSHDGEEYEMYNDMIRVKPR